MSPPPPKAPTSRPAPDSPDLPQAAAGAGPGVSTTRPTMVWAALSIVYVVWGSTYLGIRITVETLPPLLSAAARFAAAAAVLAVILRVRRGRGALRVSGRQLASAALVGALLLVSGNGLVALAESGPPGVALPSGIAALLVAMVPLLVVVLRTVSGDRPRVPTVVGVAAGFAGLVVLVLPSGGAGSVPIVGALTVVVAATSWSIGSFLSSRISTPDDPFVASVYEMAVAAAALAVIGVGRGELDGFDLAAVSARSWLGLAYLAAFGSLVAFTAYVWLLHHAPISLAATYAYVNPVVAVALGALLLAEPVTPQLLLGGGVILVGVVLVVTTERPRSGRPRG